MGWALFALVFDIYPSNQSIAELTANPKLKKVINLSAHSL